MKKTITKGKVVLLLTVLGSSFLAGGSWAAETGGSAYLQGTYNDFAMGMVGPPGFYMRKNIFYYETGVAVHPLGGLISRSGQGELERPCFTSRPVDSWFDKRWTPGDCGLVK